MSHKHKKVLAFAGSVRKQSYNKNLLQRAIAAAQKYDLDVTEVDLKDYPLPLYNADDESTYGLPDSVKALKELFLQHDGLLIAAPEYNSSITPLLKNTIDWVSRKSTADEGELSAYRGKIAAIISASPGYYGGMRGLVTVRSIFSNIGVTVIPEQLCVANAHEALTDQDIFARQYQHKMEEICQSLYKHLS